METLLLRRWTIVALRSVTLLAVLSLAACDCGGGVTAVASSVSVTPEKVAFGQVPVGRVVERTVEVRNEASGVLEVSGIAWDASAQVPAGSTELSLDKLLAFDCEGEARTGFSIEPRGCARFVVRFSPTGIHPVSGRILLISNDPDSPVFTIPVSGEGVGASAVGQSRLCVLDEQGDEQESACTTDTTVPGVDFGLVRVGSASTRTVRVYNVGGANLTLQGVATVADGQGFRVNDVGAPVVIEAGLSIDVELAFLPEAAGAASDEALFELDDPAKGSYRLPLSGVGESGECGTTRPTAIVEVRGSNGVDITSTVGTDGVAQGSTLTLDASGSQMPLGVGEYRWRLASQPGGTSASIAQTGSQASIELLEVGEYVVELIVVDAAGCASTPVQLSLRSNPIGRLVVTLSWPESYGEVDLHYVGPNGSFFDYVGDSDCFFKNCRKSPYPQAYSIDWGLMGTVDADTDASNDPLLLADDHWGFGPEQVIHEAPFDATYDVVVHYFCSKKLQPPDPNDPNVKYDAFGYVTPEVRIYSDGVRVGGPFTQTLNPRDKWSVASVVVSGGGQIVQVMPGPPAGTDAIVSTPDNQVCSGELY